MKKLKRLKGAGVVAGIALAATIALSATPETARATYLGTPTVSLTKPTSGTYFETTVAASSGTFDVYVTPTSTYGDTIPTPQALNAAGIKGTIYSIGNDTPNSGPVFYDPASLNTKLLNSIDTSFSGGAANSAGVQGNILSNVYEVTSGSGTGDLVFTYQFNVTKVNVSGSGINTGSITFFDEPLNSATGVGTPWTIGTGINSSPIYPTLQGTLTSLQNLGSEVSFDPTVNNSIYQIGFASSTYITQGEVSPQLFAASNAPDYTIGSLTLEGSGAGFAGLPVFVPSNTPEPGTLVLFGTALGLVAFMAVRRRRSQVVA